MTSSATVLKQFPNGDVAMDDGHGLIYRTHDAAYTVQVDPPEHADEPFGVDLVRTTRSEYGLEREQRLTLAEYYSDVSAEAFVRAVEQRLIEHGRDGLSAEMALVDALPFEPDTATYLVGLYPPEPEVERATLNLIRLKGDRLDIAPLAHGPMAELAPIEQRLWDVKVEGDTGRLLEAAALEAMRADELAPGTPLFAWEGKEMTVDKTISTNTEPTPPEWENHPDWPDAGVWEQPPAPKSAARLLPVTFDEDMIPTNAQGRYVPHHRDETGTVHFFSVVERPADSPISEGVTRELRYFRAQKTEEGIVIHDSQPLIPVSDPGSPWPLPALELHLEEGELQTAQSLARQVARDNGLSFPHRLPTLGTGEPRREQESGWYHFDTALMTATPQGVDDGYSVGVVDVYANHENNRWAARYLPLDEFDTLDEALIYQQQTLLSRIAGDPTSALAVDGFNRSPAAYERIAQADADAALADLLEQHDGRYPFDFDGDYEPEWEPLTSKEWDAYRDHVRTISETVPGTQEIYESLPSATPTFASDALVEASLQPYAPYRLAEDFKPLDITPTWRLDIVPARDPDGASLGYSAVCVVDFGDLAETLSPEAPQRAQWLEVAQFQTEDRAKQFRDDFMSLSGMEELSHITGPAFANAVADDLGMESRWQIMDQPALEKLKTGAWSVVHIAAEWQPRMYEVPPTPLETSSIDF
ncbi:MAG: hypothetical protein HY866_23535 [Chloroflexi bacterium]|nr:hypothetical protein [Chloroflexota bacterium]